MSAWALREEGVTFHWGVSQIISWRILLEDHEFQLAEVMMGRECYICLRETFSEQGCVDKRLCVACVKSISGMHVYICCWKSASVLRVSPWPLSSWQQPQIAPPLWAAQPSWPPGTWAGTPCPPVGSPSCPSSSLEALRDETCTSDTFAHH